MKLIPRSELMERLIDLQGTPDIKIITGIRRSGKSQLMREYISYITDSDPAANIIFVDLMELKNERLKEYHALNDYIEAHWQAEKNNYLFVDEVQMCEKFELTINSLYTSGKYDIYITGSNAFLLSNDLATLFTGRYMEVHVFPFSFKEYIKYFGTDKIDDSFDEYVKHGGFAGSYPYRTEKDRVGYIKDVYNTIVSRDLVQKYRITDSTVLGHLTEFMMDNISNLTSANNISETLSQNQIAANHVTVRKYIKYLSSAYIFYPIQRYDIKGKKYLKSSVKYYLCDTGIRYAILGMRNMDYGRVYENMVCIELLRRGYEVYVGKLYKKEIDFVAVNGSEKIYIQVSDNISEARTFQREYEPLLQIKDAYPKMILARTRHEDYDYEGIKICDIARWMLTE